MVYEKAVITKILQLNNNEILQKGIHTCEKEQKITCKLLANTKAKGSLLFNYTKPTGET